MLIINLKYFCFTLNLYFLIWPSKSDSVPVCGDGYEPRSLKLRSRANAETLYSVRTGPGGGCRR